MARELLIFRHGKSDWTTGAAEDFDRPLAKRGRKAIKQMARWLRDQRLLPQHIVSSPAERARQTALRLCRHGDIPESAVRWDDRIYAADVDTLVEVLSQCEPEGRTMIVGHNPGLEELVEYLSGEAIDVSDDRPKLPTAALAQLSMPNDWSHLERGCARLIKITRPREI